MLCLTAKRRGRTQGFRGMLHACKPNPGGRFQVWSHEVEPHELMYQSACEPYMYSL
jgi:hypothetical protein